MPYSIVKLILLTPLVIFSILWSEIHSTVFQKFAIWQVQKYFNLENSKNFKFAKFEKFLIYKIQKLCDLNFFLNCNVVSSKNSPNISISENINVFKLLRSKSVEIDLYQRANIRIGKIASSLEYRMDEQFQNCQFLEPNIDSLNWKNL